MGLSGGAVVLTTLADYLDKGASLGRDKPCLTLGDASMTYGEAQDLSYAVARALHRSGVRAGDKVGILSANDPVAYATVFGIARRGAVWCPINPRNEAAENRDLLKLMDCSCLIFQRSFAPLVQRIVGELPALMLLVCLDGELEGVPSFEKWLSEAAEDSTGPALAAPPDDVAVILGTSGTTGRPKGVVLTVRNFEVRSAMTLWGYPYHGRPVFLAIAPLTHATGMICFPMLTLGAEVVVMPKAELAEFLRLVEHNRVTHTMLPPTLIYLLLRHERLATTDLSSLQCLIYGSAPMSSVRLEEALTAIGPVFGQVYGQSESPHMTAMHPRDYFNDDGTVARHRLASAGKPHPLVTMGIMDGHGRLLERGERGEIVVRGAGVSPGYYHNAAATAEVRRFGWHHTGDIGYLDDEGYLFIVDRAKDLIISGGFNVYSAEVEQALMAHSAVRECAVVGIPHDKWGEQVTAVVQLQPGAEAVPEELISFVKARIGSVKAPKQIMIWPELPRNSTGKILKTDVRTRLTQAAGS
jgi:acyl-CoA synthetase (AMP-forming)/AMP-acid ligase II